VPEEFMEGAEARRPIPPWRILAALGLLLMLLVPSVLYHDGLLDADPLNEVDEPNALYRVRGTATDVEAESFFLEADGFRLRVQWNLTTPQTGSTYVVNGVYNATGESLDGHAVVRAMFF
jgi:hypothetical protein